MAVFDELEREQIAARTSDAMLRHQTAGRRMTRPSLPLRLATRPHGPRPPGRGRRGADRHRPYPPGARRRPRPPRSRPSSRRIRHPLPQPPLVTLACWWHSVANGALKRTLQWPWPISAVADRVRPNRLTLQECCKDPATDNSFMVQL
jgi:hypothetical protein